MPARPVIVTGCGRSGTHWLGGIMAGVFGPEGGAFEPEDYSRLTDVVVDSQLRHKARSIAADGHPVIHLVRDGRDVVRSLRTWYGHNRDFLGCCNEWREAVNMLRGFPVLRLEDLIKRGDPTKEHSILHWSEWDDDMTRLFWERCGGAMREMGYHEE